MGKIHTTIAPYLLFTVSFLLYSVESPTRSNRVIYIRRHISTFGNTPLLAKRAQLKSMKNSSLHEDNKLIISLQKHQSPGTSVLIDYNQHHISTFVSFRSNRSLLFKFRTLCIFEPPLGGLRDNYDVHLGLIGKRVVDFLLVLIEVLSLGVIRLSRYEWRDRKSAISLQRGGFDPKFQGGSPPTNHFCTVS